MRVNSEWQKDDISLLFPPPGYRPIWTDENLLFQVNQVNTIQMRKYAGENKDLTDKATRMIG